MRPVMPVPPRLPFALGGAALLISLAISAVVIVLSIVIWWRIFAKAGYSGAMGLLMFIPIANIIALLILAFGQWPIEEEIQRLRGRFGRE